MGASSRLSTRPRSTTSPGRSPPIPQPSRKREGSPNDSHWPAQAAAEARRGALGAPTWYAASGADEMFPEVWALYHTDPHFLCGQAPLIYAWLDSLSSTGSPPAATAALVPVANCPA